MADQTPEPRFRATQALEGGTVRWVSHSGINVEVMMFLRELSLPPHILAALADAGLHTVTDWALWNKEGQTLAELGLSDADSAAFMQTMARVFPGDEAANAGAKWVKNYAPCGGCLLHPARNLLHNAGGLGPFQLQPSPF